MLIFREVPHIHQLQIDYTVYRKLSKSYKMKMNFTFYPPSTIFDGSLTGVKFYVEKCEMTKIPLV